MKQKDQEITTQQPQTLPQYTPGPWTYERGTDGCEDMWYIVPCSDDRAVASITFWDDFGPSGKRIEADARLLAAAPELLNSLKELLGITQSLPETTFKFQQLKAQFAAVLLVAKTEGRE